ncbi:MAG: Holliday junction branch migration DNA helicase RuvB [Bacilli bacterium]|jgi:holliday junction DNA helicase RuvB
MPNNDNYLRPTLIENYFGQKTIIEELKVYIFSAKKRKTVLDHMLFYGPPGLGKTSLAYVVANEMKAKIVTVSASAIKEIQDMVSILGTLDPGDILFIDEIHNLDREVEEILYSAMEDFKINITYKSEENSKAITLDLSPFTLIGATTMAGSISTPLRDRFGIIFKFNYYTSNELKEIIQNNAKKIHLHLLVSAIKEIAARSRKTPRVANNILKRILDYSVFYGIKKFDEQNILEAFKFLNINEFGLSEVDIQILSCLSKKFGGKPVSLEAVASVLNENVINIRDINEPYLVNSGFIERTKQGRQITKTGVEILTKIIKKND